MITIIFLILFILIFFLLALLHFRLNNLRDYIDIKYKIIKAEMEGHKNE